MSKRSQKGRGRRKKEKTRKSLGCFHGRVKFAKVRLLTFKQIYFIEDTAYALCDHSPSYRLLDDLLCSLEVTPSARSHLCSLLTETAKVAYRNQFSCSQVRALLGVLQVVLEYDTQGWQRTAPESFAFFQESLLRLCVERPPHSSGIFNPVQATALMNFFLKTYYQHFSLYKAVCCRKPALSLSTRGTCDVPAPDLPRPLSEAVLM